MPTALQKRPWPVGRIGKYISLTLLVLVVFYAAWSYWLFKGGVFSTAAFDSTEWHVKQTNATDWSCFRGGMANDIKNRILKSGLPRADVKGLLGQPDVEKPGKFEYNLGMCSGLRIDFDSLNVYFNESGVVESVSIVQH